MLKVGSEFAPVSVDAVKDSLRLQGIPFRGPFCTPAKRIAFVVERYIFLESELVDLVAQNNLNRDGIQEVAKRIQCGSPKLRPTVKSIR